MAKEEARLAELQARCQRVWLIAPCVWLIAPLWARSHAGEWLIATECH